MTGYLKGLAPALESSINALEAAPTVGNIVPVTHLTAQFCILGKATSNTAHDIDFGDSKYLHLTYLYGMPTLTSLTSAACAQRHLLLFKTH